MCCVLLAIRFLVHVTKPLARSKDTYPTLPYTSTTTKMSRPLSFSSSVPQNGHNSNSNNNNNNKKKKCDTNTSTIGYRLDPPDWAAYRADLHQLVDACCDRMEQYRQLPWQPPPADLMTRLCIAHESNNHDNSDNVDLGSQPQSKVQERLVNEIMPYATGNTHPQFFGWVHGAGIPGTSLILYVCVCASKKLLYI